MKPVGTVETGAADEWCQKKTLYVKKVCSLDPFYNDKYYLALFETNLYPCL